MESRKRKFITLALSLPFNCEQLDLLQENITAFVEHLHDFNVKVARKESYENEILFHSQADAVVFALLSIEHQYTFNKEPFWKISAVFQPLITGVKSNFISLLSATSINSILLECLDKTNRIAFANPGLTFKALQIIDKEYANINLNKAAIKLNVSPSYLSQVIAKNTTSSFTDLVHIRRIINGISLLKGGDRHATLDEIAEALGYNDVHYFCRVFKKYAGVTPGYTREFLDIYALDNLVQDLFIT